MFDENASSVLLCPTCSARELKAEIDTSVDAMQQEGELVCGSCETSYPVHHSVADLTPYSLLDTPEWRLWQDHLQGLQARRKQRLEHKGQITSRLSRASRSGVKDAFCRFTRIGGGRILDVGCGPGSIQRHLERYSAGRVEYYGLDPVPFPDTRFFFVQGVAEYLPFKDDTFAHLIVTSSLDHFCEPDRFFREVTRVLTPEGRFHLLQSIHETSSPIKAAKTLFHTVKDRLERPQTTIRNPRAPKHLAEYNRTTILETLGRHFEVTAQSDYTSRWYSPTKLFVSTRAAACVPG